MSKAVLIRADHTGSEILYCDGSTGLSSKAPLKLLNEQCLNNGSSLEGRMDSFRHILAIRQKAAVLISEVTQEIWFPTLSMKAKDCVWLRCDQILDVRAAGSHACEIVFFSGFRITLDIGIRTVRLQMKRCHQYLEILSRNTAVRQGENDPLSAIRGIV